MKRRRTPQEALTLAITRWFRPDPAECHRHHLSRSQEQSLRDFFHRHNPDCEHCGGVGHYFVDGQKIICMVRK